MAQPLAEVRQFEPSDEGKQIIAEAQAAQQKGDANAKLAVLKSYAERKTQDAAEQNEKAAEAQRLYSFALFMERRLEEAVIAMRKVTELEPKNPHSHAELAQLAFAAKKFTLGMEACVTALLLFKELAEENPERYEPEVAKTLHSLGEMCETEGRRTEALSAFEKALAISQKLAATDPAAHEPVLALIFNSLGRFYADQNQKKKALNAYHQALAIRQKLAEADPALYEQDLAATLNDLGQAYGTSPRQRTEAFRLCNQALAIYQKRREANPAAYDARISDTLGNIAILYGDNKQWQKALDVFNQALAIDRKLAEADPAFKPNLAKTLMSVATVYAQIGSKPEALTLITEAVVLFTDCARTMSPFYQEHVEQAQSFKAAFEAGL